MLGSDDAEISGNVFRNIIKLSFFLGITGQLRLFDASWSIARILIPNFPEHDSDSHLENFLSYRLSTSVDDFWTVRWWIV